MRRQSVGNVQTKPLTTVMDNQKNKSTNVFALASEAMKDNDEFKTQVHSAMNGTIQKTVIDNNSEF